MTSPAIEHHQVWIYVVAILAGLGVGSAAPALAPSFEMVLWPALGFLLYTTFTQVPLIHLPAAFRDLRFMSAALIGNFVFVPLLVGGLLCFVADDPAIRLGVLLVLLVPCTDWFIPFTHLGGGDTRLAIAVTPVHLGLQLVLLPLYLYFFMGETFVEILAIHRIGTVLLVLIALPLLAAWLTERWVERRPERISLVVRIGRLPVPLLALVVFLIAGSQVNAVRDSLPLLGSVLGIFVAFLVIVPFVGMGTARLFSIPRPADRTLVFSLGTRNSFVVLPFALALSPSWQAATVVIVFQSLVELFGMAGYLWAVPRLLPEPCPERPRST